MGVKFGRQIPEAEKAALNLRTVKHLIDSEGFGVLNASGGEGNLLPPPFGRWSLVNPKPRRKTTKTTFRDPFTGALAVNGSRLI